MQLARVKEGDEIKVNIRGRVFEARVEEKLPGSKVRITPLTPNISYYHATAAQVEKVVKRNR